MDLRAGASIPRAQTALPYKLVALDIDGTLVEPGCGCARPVVQRAVGAVQALGAKVAIASGRCQLAAVDARVLGGIRPDYAVCAGGAQLIDAAGRELFACPLTPKQMYALVDFCENYEHELAFSFSDGYYVYIGHEAVAAHYRALAEHTEFIRDGEDQNRHLKSMPYAAFCHMAPARAEEFGRLYRHLGLRFVPYAPGWYDVCQAGLTKAGGLAALLGLLGLSAGEMLAVGDAENDVEMLKMAGLGVAMANAAPPAKAAAGRIAPDVREDGAALLLDGLFGLGLGLAQRADAGMPGAAAGQPAGAVLHAAAPQPPGMGAAGPGEEKL